MRCCGKQGMDQECCIVQRGNNKQKNFLRVYGRATWWICLTWLLLACSSWQPMEEPEVSVVGFRLLEAGNLFSQPYELTVKVSNPNDRPLDVERIVFDFALDDAVLLRGRSQTIPVIAPYGEGTFIAKGTVGLSDAFRMLKQVLGGKEGNQFHYRMTARVTLRHQWPSTFNLVREGDISPADMIRGVNAP